MIRALLVVAALASAAPSVTANSGFTVVDSTGTPVSGATLLAGDRKVVLYVSSNLEPAARLVDALKRWSQADPRWRDRVVVIVAGAHPDARAWLMQRWGAGELPVWVADPGLEGWKALGFQGTVGVAGAEQGRVDWKLDGVIADPAVVEPTVRAWIGIEVQ